MFVWWTTMILILVYFIFLGMYITYFIKYILFRRKAIKVEAVIIDYITEQGLENTSYYPIFEYNVPKYGKMNTVGTIFASFEPKRGTKKVIYYNPESPQEISYSFMFNNIIYCIIFVITSLVMACIISELFWI